MTSNVAPTARFLRRRQVSRAMAAALLAAGTQSRAQGGAKPLQVGGLPVTCNLTLPVACAASSADKGVPQTSGALFEFSKYSSWPEIKESLMMGRIKAADMLAPLRNITPARITL